MKSKLIKVIKCDAIKVIEWIKFDKIKVNQTD